MSASKSLEYITDEERKSIGHPYSPELVAEVQAIIDDQLRNKSQPLTAWGRVMDILDRENIPYTLMLNVMQTLTHPKNRNNSMLNPFNSQRVVKLVKRSGASKDELKKACAIEICPIQSIRKNRLIRTSS